MCILYGRLRLAQRYCLEIGRLGKLTQSFHHSIVHLPLMCCLQYDGITCRYTDPNLRCVCLSLHYLSCLCRMAKTSTLRHNDADTQASSGTNNASGYIHAYKFCIHAHRCMGHSLDEWWVQIRVFEHTPSAVLGWTTSLTCSKGGLKRISSHFLH